MGLHPHLRHPARVSAHGCMVSRFVGLDNGVHKCPGYSHLSQAFTSIGSIMAAVRRVSKACKYTCWRRCFSGSLFREMTLAVVDFIPTILLQTISSSLSDNRSHPLPLLGDFTFPPFTQQNIRAKFTAVNALLCLLHRSPIPPQLAPRLHCQTFTPQ